MSKKKPIIVFIVVAIAVVVFFFIQSKEVMRDGGPCTYTTTIHPAKVIAIVPIDSSKSDVKFEVVMPGRKETLSYYAEQKHYLNKEEISKQDLSLGNEFCYEEHTITSGSCNPHFFVLKMERIKK